MNLVLSLFPGIGLLDRAFEEHGFSIARGPDVLWGGDVKKFHVPAGVFTGVIGGPPCQAHSTFARINRARGNKIREDLVPEFVRIVDEARPKWFLMENVPAVPDVELPPYRVHRLTLDARWVGAVQRRRRVFQFGSIDGTPLQPEIVALEQIDIEPPCLASEGRSGKIEIKGHDRRKLSYYHQSRPWAKFCELQGLPPSFLDESPFTKEAKYRAVGNGVPLQLGRAIAKAIVDATGV